MNDNLTMWHSKRKFLISCSIAEVEYIIIVNAICVIF